MGIEEVLNKFNLSIEEYNDRLFGEPSYVTNADAEALVFDGDDGVMLVSTGHESTTYKLIECNYFEDFSDMLPRISKVLTGIYSAIEDE